MPITLTNKHDLLTVLPAEVKIAQLNTNQSGTYAFKNFNKFEFIKHLRNRIKDKPTENIDQAATSLCGPAVILYVILIREKDLFVNFAVNLFLYGEAYLGDLHVKPGQGTKNMLAANLGYMSPVDWVILASLRDSENSILDYDDVTDATAGMTTPGDIESWCRQIGFQHVVKNANIFVFSKGIDDLRLAQEYMLNGYSVFLLLDAQVLGNANPSSSSFWPTHWVVLNSNITIDHTILNKVNSDKLVEELYAYLSDDEEDQNVTSFNHNIRFDVFTWGTRKYPLSIGGTSLFTFVDYFYGFVAAKGLAK